MTRIECLLAPAAFAAAAMCTATSSAAYSIVQQSGVAPTYATSLNFDEPGAPTGVLPPGTWIPGYGVSIAGPAGDVAVADFGFIGPWIGTGNSVAGDGGVNLTFVSKVTEISFQAWDPSGPPSPFFGGGIVVQLFNGGAFVSSAVFTPAWGGTGNTWFNVTTTAGSQFDHVEIFGNSFGATTFVDNLSWNAIPSPGALALLALGGLAGRRRRAD